MARNRLAIMAFGRLRRFPCFSTFSEALVDISRTRAIYRALSDYYCYSKMSEDVKRMADLLKSGATMLSDVCPVCGTPLFKVKGEVFCAKCNKPVVYQKAMSPQATLSPGYLLDSVEMTIIGKISEANEILKIEKDPEKLSVYSNLVFGWLSMLEKLRGLKDSFKE